MQEAVRRNEIGIQLIDEIDSRLQEWADWVLSGDGGGLGLPRRSTIDKLMKEGYGAHEHNVRIDDMSESVLEVEQALSKLKRERPKYIRLALFFYYLQRCDNASKAKEIHMTEMQFLSAVALGHHYLAAELL